MKYKACVVSTVKSVFQVSYLLQQLMKLTAGCPLDENEMANLLEFCDRVEAISASSDRFERITKENRKLTQVSALLDLEVGLRVNGSGLAAFICVIGRH